MKADVAYVEDVRLRALQMDMDKIGAETSYMFLNNESKYPEEQIDTVFGEAVFSLNAWITEMSNVDKIISETANKKGTEIIEEGKKEEAISDNEKEEDDDDDGYEAEEEDDDDEEDGEEKEKQAGNSVGNASNQPGSPKPLPMSQGYQDLNPQSVMGGGDDEDDEDDDEDGEGDNTALQNREHQNKNKQASNRNGTNGYNTDEESDDSEEWNDDGENSDREENIKATIDRLVGNVKRNRDDTSSDDSEDLDNNDEKLDTDDRIENSREEGGGNEEDGNDDAQKEDEGETVESVEETEKDDEDAATPPKKRQKIDANPVSLETAEESVPETEVDTGDEENEDEYETDEEYGEELSKNISSNTGRLISTTRAGSRKNNGMINASGITEDGDISIYQDKDQTSRIVERSNPLGVINKELMSNWIRVGNPADDATDTREEYNETARKADPKNDNDPLVRSKDF